MQDLAHTRLAALGDRRRQARSLPAPEHQCDATGEVWRGRPIALAYVDVPGNAAKALAHLELAFPVEASARKTTPFLTADNATPLTHSQADKLLASLLADCLCPEEASRYSWHSFRIGLATRLQCAGCPPHLIQALYRWQSPESFTFYCRVKASIYERWRSASCAAHFDTPTPLNVAVGSDAHFQQFALAASALVFASTPLTSAPMPTVAASSCPPPTADASGTAALPSQSTHPTHLRLPAPARRTLGELVLVCTQAPLACVCLSRVRWARLDGSHSLPHEAL
eukprot:2664827-Pleurochrysis_carterae.AAC.1